MKKIFTLLFSLSLIAANLHAQALLADDFNYSGLLTANGWTLTGTNVDDPISTTTGLVYPGYPGSGIGNAALLTGTNEDVNRGFTNQTGQGMQIWMSALINVTDTGKNSGGYFLHLGDRSDTDPSTFTQFAARLFTRTDSLGNVNFGVSNTSTPTYGTTNFLKNTTYLVVIKYTNDTTAASPDEVKLWVLASGVPADEASLGTPEVVNSLTVGLNNLDAVGIRQASSGVPDVIVDGLRIATSYVSVLPLNLVSFKASLTGGLVKLNWTSSNEKNVKDFTIERSTDGIKYSSIGAVAAKNTSEATYSFTDAAPLADVNYYRLKMTDKDGAYRYSQVVTINNRTGIKAQVFPNPVVNTVMVNHTKAVAGASLKIVNMQGQQLKLITVEQGATQTSFMATEFRKGNYILIYQNGKEKSVAKFIK